MLPGLVWPDGYDYEAIRVTLDIHEVAQAARPALFHLILQLINVVEAEKRSRHRT